MIRKPKHPKQPSSADRLMRLPAGTVSRDAHIEMMGNSELCIEGCCAVLEYTGELIRLNCTRRQLTVMGTSLSIVALDSRVCQIEGMITVISFTE